MHDEYYMNTETGEILPALQAISVFYRDHGPLEAWTDEWIATGMEAESFIDAPDFTRALRC